MSARPQPDPFARDAAVIGWLILAVGLGYGPINLGVDAIAYAHLINEGPTAVTEDDQPAFAELEDLVDVVNATASAAAARTP